MVKTYLIIATLSIGYEISFFVRTPEPLAPRLAHAHAMPSHTALHDSQRHWHVVLAAAQVTTFMMLPHDENEAFMERLVCFFAELLYLFCVNILYQGLLDVHSMLRNPNQDRYIGHLCTQKFLKFTFDVSNNLVHNLESKPQWQRQQHGAPTDSDAWGRQAARPSLQTVKSEDFAVRRHSIHGQQNKGRAQSTVMEVFDIENVV